MVARHKTCFSSHRDVLDFGGKDDESGGSDGDELQMRTIDVAGVARGYENSNSRPLRGELRHRFKYHLGHLEARGDPSNPFNRTFVVFCGRIISAVQIDDDGREENRRGEVNEGADKGRKRFEWAVWLFSAGQVDGGSRL